MPVKRSKTSLMYNFPFVDTHSRLVAWWLVVCWRVKQLAAATALHQKGSDVIAAAACARPLLETVAALWVDACRLADQWTTLKSLGPPARDNDGYNSWRKLSKSLYEIMYGAKFDDRRPQLKKSYGLPRTNILSSIDKLAEATSGPLLTDYQWLCNTVHPSIGGAFAFSAPPLIHKSRTQSLIWFHAKSVRILDKEMEVTERSRARGSCQCSA